jgi:hypothetical protein
MAKTNEKDAPAQTAKTEETKQYKRTASVITPTLKLEQDKSYFVRATGKMFIGKTIKTSDGKPPKEPATILPVCEIESGQLCEIVCNTVLKANLDEKYPGGSYVGKSFEIIKRAKREGKQYNAFEIYEIEA